MPTIIPRSDHPISRDDISKNALKVLYRLKDAGFRACLVGGGVRDLLLGITPKDFDVATDATPDEVNALFKNCRLIGRRFRLAHIRYGREIIEVATFRGSGESEVEAFDELDEHSDFDENDTDEEDSVGNRTDNDPEIEMDDNRGNLITHSSLRASPRRDSKPALNIHQKNNHGFITRDNIYGTIEEDAERRDLTINALYYDIDDFSIIDYCGGVEDIRERHIRLIGAPKTRYQEDPVRMLRVIRFANKLGFSIDNDTEAAIAECAPLLKNIPPARLIDEGLKMFMGGQAIQNYQSLDEHGLLAAIIPVTLRAIDSGNEAQRQYFHQFIQQGLTNSDARVADDKPITPYYMLAVLLWPAVVMGMQPRLAKGASYQDTVHAVTDELLLSQRDHIAIPRRYSTPMKEVWLLQSRLERTRGKRAEKLLTHPRFRAAYDFLLLRGIAGEDVGDSAHYWTNLQASAEPIHKQNDGSRSRHLRQHKRNPRRRRPQKSS